MTTSADSKDASVLELGYRSVRTDAIKNLMETKNMAAPAIRTLETIARLIPAVKLTQNAKEEYVTGLQKAYNHAWAHVLAQKLDVVQLYETQKANPSHVRWADTASSVSVGE